MTIRAAAAASAPRPVLVVAGLSVRPLAEAAQAEGFDVIALDAFGDADTRRASIEWQPIGADDGLRLDPSRLLAALAAAAARGDRAPLGWIAASGFEGRTDLLAAGAERLPLRGLPAEAVRRLRDPAQFFAVLDAHGIAHPEVRLAGAAPGPGWLRKDAGGCGGVHIREAAVGAGTAPGPGQYLQRQQPGLPMSATFLADGRTAAVLGFNELIVRPLGGLPHVYLGAIGPLPLAPAAAAQVRAALAVLVPAFALRGLGSLDFILDAGGDAVVLEVNPRPPATLALYGPGAGGRGLVAAHLRACGGPAAGGAPFAPPPAGRPAGIRIVDAPRPFCLDAAGAWWLAERDDVHDLPCAGVRFAAGDPVCSVSARGDDAEAVRHNLDRAAARLRAALPALEEDGVADR